MAAEFHIQFNNSRSLQPCWQLFRGLYGLYLGTVALWAEYTVVGRQTDKQTEQGTG